jgi:hypothetical protein
VREKPKFFGLVREEGRKRWNQLDDDKELGGAWYIMNCGPSSSVRFVQVTTSTGVRTNRSGQFRAA